MKTFIQKIKHIFQDTDIRNRILFMLGILVIYRIFATIPIPGVDAFQLEQFFSNNQFLGLLNIFSGGGLSNLSIVMLGLSPYITASIIMQLMTVMSERIREMYHEEGDAGRRKIAQWSRLMTVPLAAIQGFGFLLILERSGVIAELAGFALAVNMSIIIAGSLLLTWLGELISEFGIGNGVSLLIFAGIVAALPSTVQQLVFNFSPDQIPLYLGMLLVAIAITYGVVIITEAERPIPITYAKRVRGNKVYGGISTYLPLRLNQAGVIPIIFALSILLFPQTILGFLVNVDNTLVQRVSNYILNLLQNQWFYGGMYFLLVFVFTYFYTAITFDPDTIADNLQRGGAFIPGVRPGQPTVDYIGNVLTRLTLVGALFLGAIAVLPIILQGITGFASLTIGGTALLIVVSVVIDIVKRVDAQVSMREY
jgi:preprotein translocase subunit SecY